MSILTSHMMVTKNLQNVHRKCFWTILVTFIFNVKIDINMCEPHYVNLFFFVNLLHSLCVSLFDIWHLFDILTYFWHFDIFLTFWHIFDILTYFWHFDIFLTFWHLFDILTSFFLFFMDPHKIIGSQKFHVPITHVPHPPRCPISI